MDPICYGTSPFGFLRDGKQNPVDHPVVSTRHWIGIETPVEPDSLFNATGCKG